MASSAAIQDFTKKTTIGDFMAQERKRRRAGVPNLNPQADPIKWGRLYVPVLGLFVASIASLGLAVLPYLR